MQMTVSVDESLLKAAQNYSGLATDTELIAAALQALVERGTARRLARMGGTEPDLPSIPRRRQKAA